MKEDILEQLVDGYFLRQRSTFTKHNIKYKPSENDISKFSIEAKKKYHVHSDIDVLAVQLVENQPNIVSVISCKSWQDGLEIDRIYRELKNGKGGMCKKFRELVEPVWAKAFRDKIYEETKSHNFTYYIAITKFKGKKLENIEDFKICNKFLKNLSHDENCSVKIEFLQLENMLKEILQEDTKTAVEATEIGRFVQLIKAAGLGIKYRLTDS